MEIESNCDAVWPDEDADPSDFAGVVAEALATLGYCSVHMPMSDGDREEAVRIASRLKDPLTIPLEFVLDYLGRKNCTKAMQLGHDTPDKPLSDPLRVCDRQMTQLGLMLAPYAEPFLGFYASGRTQGLVRSKYSTPAEETQMFPTPLMEDDVEDGLVENHLSFLRSRQICMLYMIENDGGELLLYPQGQDTVTIPVAKDKLVLFHHTHMSFEYRPKGTGLALQSWMSAPISSFQLDNLQGEASASDEVVGITGAKRPVQRQTQVMSMSVRVPGNAISGNTWFAAASAGCDGVTQWPMDRFDESVYYSPDPSQTYLGKSYTNHGGFLPDDQIWTLDTAFFGIPDDYAKCMSINQRMWLEVGYAALYQGGWRRPTLKGAKMGCYIGDVGSDWHTYTSYVSMLVYDGFHTATAVHSSVTPARLSHIMGMEGPTMTFDTACSASLYATHHANMSMINFMEWGEKSDGSLVGGVNSMGPQGHVNNCMGNILSHIGRCHTFDEAADGYQRGEGSAGIYMKMTDSFSDLEVRLAAVMGTCASQDGKSASLTAPSGPAQQQMLRKSFHMADIDTLDVAFTEVHGTGTALGDPIEMGAIIAVFDEDRESPLLHTTPKTNLGHLESGAGVSGLTRCILGLQFQCAAPNVHFARLNPHMEAEGFPRLFQSEPTETGQNAGYAGVSSFGFAGADARCEFYGKATMGPRCKDEMNLEKLDFVSIACPKCMGPMCWRCGCAIPSHTQKAQHRCTLIREEFADYEICNNCDMSSYRYGEPIRDLVQWDAKEPVSIIGSWNRWTEPTLMDQIEDGVYVCCVVLGDTRWEHFQLVVDDNQEDAFYPPSARASASMRVMGPDAGGHGKYWFIDGLTDKQASGTVYKVTFEWTEPKKISWEVMEEEPKDLMPIVGKENEHKYFVAGTWNRFGMQEMARLGDGYEFTFSFTEHGMGREEFYFLRDRDTQQQIYPEVDHCEAESVRVMGPDGGGPGTLDAEQNSSDSLAAVRKWTLRGEKKEVVTLRLLVRNAHIALTVVREHGETHFESWEKEGHAYYLSWQRDKTLKQMLPDEENANVYRCVVEMEVPEEYFQIIVDEDRSQMMYPCTDEAAPYTADGMLMGPDDQGAGMRWSIVGEPGTFAVIVLDMNEQDRRKMVSWAETEQSLGILES